MFKAYVVHISDRVLYEGMAESLLLPGVVGEFEIKALHAPMVSLLKAGTVLVEMPGSESGNLNERMTMVEREGRFFAILPIKQGLMRFDGLDLFAVVE